MNYDHASISWLHAAMMSALPAVGRAREGVRLTVCPRP
jgi:hypothetical protein